MPSDSEPAAGAPGTDPQSHPGSVLGPRAGKLLAALELRLAARRVAAAELLALAAFLLILELLAAALAFGGPGLVALAEAAGGPLPWLAVALAAAGLAPLVRRPSRVYLASLVERARPELGGQLVLLAEHGAGRAELPAGADEHMAERVEAVLGHWPASPRAAAALERPGRRAPAALAAALAAGLGLAAAGGAQYLEALGELGGLPGAGPTRLAVYPGDAEVDEGQSLEVRCRAAGRAPRSVGLLVGGGQVGMLRGADGLWRGSFRPAGPGSYSLVADSRGRRFQAGPYAVTVRARPLAWVEQVVYRYPEYTGLAPRASESPEIDCLIGALAELRLATRGPVGRVELQVEPGGTLSAERGPDGLWRAELRVRRVGAYSVWVAPQAGGAAREVFRGTVTARADLAPTAAALARRLADGRVAIDYRIADDYRLGPAKMTFTAGGKRLSYEVPDVAGRREAQGAVLVPKEVLAAATESFLYRIEAADTRAPEPNRTAGPDQEFRVERELAMAGPVLEKRPLQMAGQHERPGSSGGADAGAPAGQTTRPLESLYKPGEEEGDGKAPPGGSAPPKPTDDPYVAPSGGQAPDEPPDSKKPGGEPKPGGGEPPPEGGPGTGQAPQEPTVNTPKPGGGPGDGGGSQNTPGGKSGGGPGSGNDGGGSKPTQKPPTGNETGAGAGAPERVMPGKVNMDLKPGEAPRPGGAMPPPLRTDFGGLRPGRPGAPLEPASARAPDGTLRPGALPAAERAEAGGALAPAAQVAPQYRRYVNEYLAALAAEGR